MGEPRHDHGHIFSWPSPFSAVSKSYDPPSADNRLKIFLYYSLIEFKKPKKIIMILFNLGVYFIFLVLYTVHKFNIMMYHSSNCHYHGHLAIVASAGFFVLLASFTAWIKFVSQMEVSYSKLLTRYQSRNGSCFAVNRKHKVKQKRVYRWFRGNADY